MKAVVDTNVLVSGLLSPLGGPAAILEAWRHERFQLVTSASLIDELRHVLARPRIADRLGWSADERRQFVAAFEASAVVVAPEITLDIVTDDPADNRVLEATLAGEVDYIVSGDRHLLELGNYEEIPISAPARFLAMLSLA